MTIQAQIADGIYADGFHVIDNFLDQEIYRALRTVIQIKHQGGAFKPAKTGQMLHKTSNATVRNDVISWLDDKGRCTAIKAYFMALNQLRETLNQSLFLGLVDCEAHFAIYQPNHFYRKHVDQFAATKDRRISCVYYLNDEWLQEYGGELILYDSFDKPISRIMPEGNRFVCFNSNIVHEVCTSYQTRQSIAAWLKNRPMALTL